MEDFNGLMRKAVIDGIKRIPNPRVIMLGSNMYIGTDGLLKYFNGSKYIDFFRVRELHNNRDFDSYLAVDVDIKDKEGKREIKLAKNRPVASSLENLKIESNKTCTKVFKEDGTLIICIEQITLADESLPKEGPVRMAIESGLIESIVRITGNFSVAGTVISMTTDELSSGNGGKLMGNLKANGDFLILHPEGGFSF
jgi:hypothetical protein